MKMQTSEPYKKCIYTSTAFCPYFPMVLLNNAFGNRKSQPIASGTVPAFINTVETPEDVLKICFCHSFSYALNRKYAGMLLLFQADSHAGW